jgi:hypothetical protein
MGLNQYSELLTYLKELLENDPLINTVTKGSLDELDLNKMDISPLAHIMVTNPNFNNAQVITFDVELTVVDVVDVNKEVNTNKFWGNDNETDVLNETLAIINRVYSILLRDFQDKGFTAIQNATATEVENTKNNMIGWTLPFQVQMPNDTISLCQ